MDTNEYRATKSMDINERATVSMETNEERATATVDLLATDVNKEIVTESMDTIKERVGVSTSMDEESEGEEKEELPSLVNTDAQVPEAVQKLSTGANDTSVTVLPTYERDEGEEEKDLPCVVNTNTRVLEAVQGPGKNDVFITFLPTDERKEQLVREFVSSGCGCSKIKVKPCIEPFPLDHVKAVRSSGADLTHKQLDILLFLAGFVIHGQQFYNTQTGRKEKGLSFTHLGKPVCFCTFTFLHGIGRRRWRNVVASFNMHGIAPHVNSNTKKIPRHALSFSSVEYVVRFHFSYVEEYAVLLPGRVPGYTCSDLQLLPLSKSKHTIWEVYHKAAEAEGTIHPVAYTTFCYLWHKLVPSILVMKPRSDLCWQCQKSNAAIVRTANSLDAAKSQAIMEALKHLRIYKSTCEDCKRSILAYFTTGNIFTPPLPYACKP